MYRGHYPMTEADWLASTDGVEMLRWIKSSISSRRFRLFVSAFCRSLWDELTPKQAREAIDVLECYANGLATVSELGDARISAHEAADNLLNLLEGGQSGWGATLHAQANTLINATLTAFPDKVDPGQWCKRWIPSPEVQARLLRCICNPYHRVALESSWLTPTVLLLGQAAENERTRSSSEIGRELVSVLADALEEAGCTEQFFLDHLRWPESNTLGCWALDLVLGRE
jgi:hypothetical protein